MFCRIRGWDDTGMPVASNIFWWSWPWYNADETHKLNDEMKMLRTTWSPWTDSTVNKPDRVSVSCSTLSLWLDSNDYCKMLLGSKTQHVRKAYFVFVKIWITTNRMVLGWSSNLTLVMSTPRIHRMALGWLGSWRLWRKPLSQIRPFFFSLTILVPQNV